MKDTKTIEREYKEELQPKLQAAMCLLYILQGNLDTINFRCSEYEKETSKKPTPLWMRISDYLERELLQSSIEDLKKQIQTLEFNY